MGCGLGAFIERLLRAAERALTWFPVTGHRASSRVAQFEVQKQTRGCSHSPSWLLALFHYPPRACLHTLTLGIPVPTASLCGLPIAPRFVSS